MCAKIIGLRSFVIAELPCRGWAIIGFLAVTLAGNAQAALFDWAVSFGSIGATVDTANGISVDSNRNVFITGSFNGNADFGITNLTSFGGSDVFVAKLSHDGGLLWVRQAGGSSEDLGKTVAVDGEGNCFVAGEFQLSANFGTTNLPALGGTTFLAKYDADGHLEWSGVLAFGYVGGIAVDQSGNCLVSASLAGTANFGESSVSSVGGLDLLLAKFDTNGRLKWAIRDGGEGSEQPRGIAIDPMGNSYVVGRFYSAQTTVFGGISLTNTADFSTFIVKYNPSGQLLWATNITGIIPGSLGVHGTGIAASDSGDCYVLGNFSDTARFGSVNLVSRGNSDVFLAKIRANGEFDWTRQVGGGGADYGGGVGVDKGGNCFVTGNFGDRATFGSTAIDGTAYDVFLTKYDPTGSMLWVQKAGGTGYDWGRAIALDSSNNCYFAGGYSQTANFGRISLESLGGEDIFVAKRSAKAIPTVTSQSTTQAVTGGASIVLSAEIESAYPVLLQWQKDGESLSGQTNITLMLPNTASTDTGSYSIIACNGDGCVTNLVAVLVVRHIVRTSTQGAGMITKAPDKLFYDIGEEVTLNATPNRWHIFTQWGEGITTNPRVITIGATNDYHAIFSPTTTLETVTFGGISRLAPVGMPAVLVDGVFFVESNVSVRGSATVSLSTTFSNGTLLFTLDGSDPSTSAGLYVGPFVVTQSVTLRAIAYNADFTQSVQSDPVEIVILPTLTATTAGGGSVAVDPPAGAYLSDGTAVVTATSAPGWRFLQWLGDATGTNPVASLSMSRNKRVQAVFGTALSNTVVGSGSVVISPESEWYPYGTTVRLTPSPSSGNYFALWGNAATGTNNPLTFAVTNPNPAVTAVFAALPANQHALTVVPDGFGIVTNSPRGNQFGNGTNVTLRALPEPGQDFLGWSGAASGASNPLVVTMTQSRVITASFTKRPRLAPILSEGVPNGEEFQFLLTGEFGGRYSIEATTNLAPAATTWEPLATLTNTFGSAQFNDSFPTNRARRFYRAVAP